jgi:leucyl aminopeptidase
MLDCTITADSGRSDLTIAVVGHCSSRLPRLVEQAAAAIAKGESKAPLDVLTPDGRYLLVKPDAKAWLGGGEAWRLLGKEVVEATRRAKVQSATVLVGGKQADVPALAAGCLLADYRYDLMRSGEEGRRKSITVRFPGHEVAVEEGAIAARAQNLARELADAPPNLLNPQTFAARARKEAGKVGLNVQVISGCAALKRAGFPGLVQVGKAGSAEPALVVISYKPKKLAKKQGKDAKGPHLALVGKGLTFDSGGISLKPGDKMWEMKGDMAGAAAVLGAITQLARSRPAIPVTAYLVLAENMPDANAQRPGDIYLARNGKSIHVDNTDAEGRLVLADVLTYACEQGASHVVDVATLTGACMVALGDRIAGLLGRDEAFLRQVRESGLEAGEELWPLPLHGEYRTLLDHPHADINNIGGRNGGTITAALFLSEFVDAKVKWAHLDIAGPAIQSGGWRYYAKGMTGFATRSLVRLAHKLG